MIIDGLVLMKHSMLERRWQLLIDFQIMSSPIVWIFTGIVHLINFELFPLYTPLLKKRPGKNEIVCPDMICLIHIPYPYGWLQ